MQQKTRSCFILFTVLVLFFSMQAQAQTALLMKGIQENNLTAIHTALQNGADVNASDADGDPVLINAALYGSAECLGVLLQQKANPNARNKFGQTPLMLCTSNLEKMKLLLQYGAHINDTSRSGNNALLIACSGSGMYENVRWLLDNGANINAKRWGFETALCRAVQFSDTTTISLLVARGQDIHAKVWGATPLLFAARMGNWDAVQWLAAHGAATNIADEDNNPVVVWAAVAGNAAAVTTLLQAKQNLNTAGTRTGMTPLMWAAYSEYDNPAIIQAFIDKGADINMKNKDGATALTWAMKKGNTATVALLKKLGAR